MNIAQIENNIQDLLKALKNESFIYDLLLAYGLPKASITRLQKGDLNLAKKAGEIAWKKKLFYREIAPDELTLFPKAVKHEDLQQAIDALKKDPKILKHAPRFIIVTDHKHFLSVDTKTADSLDIKIKDLPKHFDFFLPWAGMEKAQHQHENPADVKAAERMAKLYDEIKKENSTETAEEVHSLNVFLSRLLFCFFAEDTGIFEDDLFVNSISSHTQADGSDLDDYITKLFDVLNTKTRKGLPAYLQQFPYVNGGLFKTKHKVPKFTHRSRQAIIESGELDWSAINPDIFGSMIQAVVTPEHRGGLGMHYTSVPNIMKVIAPLFLDDLYEEFEKNKSSKPKLEKLLLRLTKIKIFDPACGSGNFLIVAYKELRKLEMKIIKQLNRLAFSGISLSQFYGIEIDDFAHEVAILSLWLAEHQMNVEFLNEFGRTEPTLPLKNAGNIVQGNATRLDWEKVCPKGKEDEVYVLGNPPYLGARMQKDSQKNDLSYVFNGIETYKNLDYIACWFYLGAKYIKGTISKCAFVSTNSICQGEQVGLLWPFIIDQKISIAFAHKSFKWKNNAKDNAAVIVVIVGLASNNSLKTRKLFTDKHLQLVNNINPYLIPASDILVIRRNNPISQLPEMPKGNMPYDGGHLILTTPEKNDLLRNFPSTSKYIRKLLGSKEFINDIERWCLWISDKDLKDALTIPAIVERISSVKEIRLNSSDESAHKLALRSHQFREINETTSSSIIVPSVSSERRQYIPIGFVDNNTIITNLAFAIYNTELWVFGILCSRMHMTWVRAVAGRLKSDYRYSSALCYNTYPLPILSEKQKENINIFTNVVLAEREKHSEKTLAQLYDPDTMPDGLREAHHQLDLAVERCYRSKPFESDEERLEYLFRLYEQMIAEEKTRGTLFEEPARTSKKRQK